MDYQRASSHQRANSYRYAAHTIAPLPIDAPFFTVVRSISQSFSVLRRTLRRWLRVGSDH